MDVLAEIIPNLKKEEIRNFKLFVSRYSNGDERRDLALFDYLKKDPLGEEEFIAKYYPATERNAYYRLKNRLLTDLGKSLLMGNIDHGEGPAYQYLLLAKFCMNRRMFPAALNYLKKSEREATALENYELLDIIYSDFVKLSREVAGVNPESYIEKRNTNYQKLDELRRIDDILAVVSHKLKRSQNLAAEQGGVLDVLEETTRQFAENRPGLTRSPRLMAALFRAVSSTLLQRRDYVSLEQYVADTLQTFETNNLFEAHNAELRLQMIIYLANASIKNNKYQAAEVHAKTLYERITNADKDFFDKYIFFYYNTLVNVYSESDLDRAVDLLEEMQNETKLQNLDFYALFVPLNLAIVWFGKKNPKKALKYLNELFANQKYTDAAPDLKLKILTVELIVRYDLEDFDFLEYRIRQVRKDFKEQLTSPAFAPEAELIALMQYMFTNSPNRKDKRIQQFLDNQAQNPNTDGQIINYARWLKEKLNLQ